MKELSTNEIVSLFKQKPEIDFRVNYYKGILKSIDNTIKAIEKRLKFGISVEVYWVFFIVPVFRRIVIDSYQKAKLEHEKWELESELYMKKEYFERWLQRSQQYEMEFEKRYKECEEFYDFIFEEATKVSKENFRLNNYMGRYENKNNDKKLKVEYYLYLKQEVENWYTKNNKKFILKKIEK